MNQPPLDHHLVVLHRGGAKRVTRRKGRHSAQVDVADKSTTTVESGNEYSWRTEGPIHFAHLYVAPERFAALVATAFDRDPRSVGFAETIGRVDGLASNIMEALIAGVRDPGWAMIGDYYVDALLVRLATISGSGVFNRPQKITLTRRTVERVIDYIRANLGERLSLDDIAAISGYSRYHFVRAFRESTGLPPYAYVLRERIAVAKELLHASDLPVAEIAARVGFTTHAQFSSRFREIVGTTPIGYRTQMAGCASGMAAIVRIPGQAEQ